MKKYLLKGIVMGVGFSLTILLTLVGYGAWVNLSTQNSGDTITSTIWNNLINNVNTIGAKVDILSNTPAGAVMAFNLSSCPTGWIKADGTNGTPDLRGEFIRGLDSGRGFDSGRGLGTSQIATQLLVDDDSYQVVGAIDWTNNDLSSLGYETSQASSSYSLKLHYNNSTSNSINGNSYLRSVRPHNVALLYCVKQ